MKFKVGDMVKFPFWDNDGIMYVGKIIDIHNSHNGYITNIKVEGSRVYCRFINQIQLIKKEQNHPLTTIFK